MAFYSSLWGRLSLRLGGEPAQHHVETVRVISLLLKSHLIHCLTESIRTMSLSQPFSLEFDSCSDPFAETSQGWSVSPGEICLLPYSEDQNQVVPPLFERSDTFDAIDEFASSI